MRRRRGILACAAAALAGPAIGAPAGETEAAVTLVSLLEEMTDRVALARWPDPAYTTGQFSSYDRASTGPGDETWWANADRGQYLRVETRGDRREFVMMDADGPGAVVRIWSANPAGTLRVYLDHAPRPALEAPMAELLGGQSFVPGPLAGIRSRGFNLFLPIPYAEHCTITSDEGDFYYQVNYRSYEPGTAARSFSMNDLHAAEGRLLETARRLDRPRAARGTVPGLEASQLNARLDAGGSARLRLPYGPAAVHELTVRLAGDDLGPAAMRSVVLELVFDGQMTVWAPVGDFFGSGMGINPGRDWMRTVGPDGSMTARWVMPYLRTAEVRLRNLGEKSIECEAQVTTAPWLWDRRSMHLHAVWRQQRDIRTLPRQDWRYVDVTGRGVLVGDSLTVTNPTRAWWGEGDEKIYVDDLSFPAHFGTGTEDYYGYAWASPELFQAPFHGQVQCDGAGEGHNYGVTTVCRLRALDAVPFTERLRFDMEIWHWKDVAVSYAATTFFYALPGARGDVGPMPEEAAVPPPVAPPLPPPLRIPGAVEAESLRMLRRTSGVAAGPQGGFEPGLWSGGHQLWVRAAAVGDFVEIELPADGPEPRRLLLYATRSWDYGIVRCTVNGERAGGDLDLYNSAAREVAATGPIDLGVFRPRDGRFVLRIEVVGSHPESLPPGTFFGVDCLVLEPAGLDHDPAKRE